MKELFKIFTPLLLIALYITYTAFFFGQVDPSDGYPIWMIDNEGNYTDQTSGIAFVGIKDGKKYFLTCDDIGTVNRVTVDERGDEPEIQITELTLSDEVKKFLKPFKKWDFEEIQIDRTNGKLYLTIEGTAKKKDDNGRFKNFEGIYELGYDNDLFNITTITSITELDFPESVFEYTRNNIGFEGLGISDNYFFLGLENVRFDDRFFTDSTVIYICDKNTKQVINKVYTGSFEIVSICGLYSISDHKLVGVDRNMRRVFLMEFDENMNVKSVKRKDLNMYVPGYPFLNTIVGIAAEGITLDNESNLYITIDPWKQMYNVSPDSEPDIDSGTLERLRSFLPILFKFEYPF